MKIVLLFLAFVGIASASPADSVAFARYRADSALAASLLKDAAHADTVALTRRIQAQTIWDLARQHLAQDTARK